MNTLNPGLIVFWFAATATITADSKLMNHPEQYRLIVFLTALIFNLSADFSKVLLANKIRNKLTPHNIHLINRISGVILIVFGIVIVITIFMRDATCRRFNSPLQYCFVFLKMNGCKLHFHLSSFFKNFFHAGFYCA